MKKIKYLGKNELEYYTKEEIKKMYPDGQYSVIGEITEKKGKNRELTVYDDAENLIYVQPTGTYKGLNYKIDGYLFNKEADAYICIKKKNWGSLLGICAVVIVAVGIAFGAYQLLKNSNFNNADIDANAIPMESEIERSDDLDPSVILVSGFNEWNMAADSDVVYIALFNPDKNPCNFKFTVVLDETQEELFTTGLVPPGHAVTTVKLPRIFTEGTYPITVKIVAYDFGDNSEEIYYEELKTDIIAIK